MDNAAFHHSDRVKQLCADAGVKLLYLSPYSPDFNPTEAFFAELKCYIKRVWSTFTQAPEQGFRAFLRKCLHEVGARRESAEGNFRHSGLTIEREPWVFTVQSVVGFVICSEPSQHRAVILDISFIYKRIFLANSPNSTLMVIYCQNSFEH